MGALTDIMGGGGGAAGKLVSAFTKKRSGGKGKPGSGGGGVDTALTSGSDDTPSTNRPTLRRPEIDSYHKGGKVRKTGLANLKKGETVMTKGQMKRLKGRGKKSRAGRAGRAGGKSR